MEWQDVTLPSGAAVAVAAPFPASFFLFNRGRGADAVCGARYGYTGTVPTLKLVRALCTSIDARSGRTSRMGRSVRPYRPSPRKVLTDYGGRPLTDYGR